ncbi:MAG: hypothetical protein SGBAC_007573 [Bacillariaceae sp.]
MSSLPTMRRFMRMSIMVLMLVALSSQASAWNQGSFFPLPFKTTALGGKHLTDAGKCLKKASNCFQNLGDSYYAYPSILREAGCSLKDAGDAWTKDNWEAVTYAMDDCSTSFLLLSQLQTTADMQAAYKGAAGELKAISGLTNRKDAGENLIQLSNYFKLVVTVEKMERHRQHIDANSFAKHLKSASKSVRNLGQEQR